MYYTAAAPAFFTENWLQGLETRASLNLQRKMCCSSINIEVVSKLALTKEGLKLG